MAAVAVEAVSDGSLDGRELLKTSHAPDSEHRPLPSSERKVRVPRTVVQQAACSLPALYTIPHRRAAGPQLIRHGDLGSAMLFRCIRKNFWRDFLVSRLRHKALPHVAVVIDAPSKGGAARRRSSRRFRPGTNASGRISCLRYDISGSPRRRSGQTCAAKTEPSRG